MNKTIANHLITLCAAHGWDAIATTHPLSRHMWRVIATRNGDRFAIKPETTVQALFTRLTTTP